MRGKRESGKAGSGVREVGSGCAFVLPAHRLAPEADVTFPAFPLPASRFPPMPLRIQFGAQLRLRRSALAEQARNDSVAMKATVFNEYLVRIVAGDDDSRDE